MKSLLIAAALLAGTSAHADITNGDIADLIRDATASASLSLVATGGGASLNVTKSSSITGNGSVDLKETPGPFNVNAGAGVAGSYANIVSGYSTWAPYTSVKATADSSWSAMLVNPFSTAMRFTISGSDNYDSQLAGSSYSYVDLGAGRYLPIYGGDVDIGVLAPGAGIKVNIVSHAEGTFVADFDGTIAGYTGGGSSIYGYGATSVAAVPEPATYALALLGLVVLLAARRRRTGEHSR